jgi:hypothetical protein
MDANTVHAIDDHDEEHEPNHHEPFEDDRITRVDTGMRTLLTLLMAVAWSLVETALAVVVVFSLLFTAIVQEPPPERVRHFANRLISYAFRIWRYMTYNEDQVPFPFSDLPDEIEPVPALGRDERTNPEDLLDAARDDVR